MTEIRIEKRASAWPWILGVLLLVVGAWAAIAVLSDDRQPVMEQAALQQEDAVGTSGTAAAAIQDYSAFASEPAEPTPGREHEYTAEGIRRLSAALDAYVDESASDAETRNRLERFRQSADRLQQDPQSREHAATVRDVFTSAVDVMESGRVDAGDVSRLRGTAASISPDRPLLDQTDSLKQFFRQSAEALSRAAQRP